MTNELLLQSKMPIPFPQGRLTIHNPELNEIAMISEEKFLSGLQFLNFSKDMLTDVDKSNLQDKTNFDIFMSIMMDKQRADYKINVQMVLALLFPTHNIKFCSDGIILTQTIDGVEEESIIDNSNFEDFKQLIYQIFDMGDMNTGGAQVNPADDRAAKIAEKLRKGRDKVAALKNQQGGANKVAIFSRYISILSVALQKDKNQLMQYTVYQLKDEFKRWQLLSQFDLNLKARLAGAQDVEEVENWMEDIHQ